jgi:glutaredoxin
MIKIYGTEGCHFCKMAVDLAESMEKEYEYIDAAENMNEFSNLFPSARTVPQILVNDEHIGGYGDLVKVLETQ